MCDGDRGDASGQSPLAHQAPSSDVTCQGHQIHEHNYRLCASHWPNTGVRWQVLGVKVATNGRESSLFALAEAQLRPDQKRLHSIASLQSRSVAVRSTPTTAECCPTDLASAEPKASSTQHHSGPASVVPLRQPCRLK